MVELAPRVVNVTRIDLIAYEWPLLELEIDCGSGTYIRSIARDVGDELGCGGLVAVLSRTRIFDHVWDDRYDGHSNTLGVHIMELRRKLEAAGSRVIHTIRGRGYYFGDPPATAREDAK